MTEPTSPFGGTAVAPPPTEVEPPADLVEGNEDNRRKLMIVGGIVVAIIVLAAAYFLVFSKGGSSTPTLAPVPHGVAPTAKPAGKSASSGAAKSGTATKSSGGAKKTGSSKTITLPKKAKKSVGVNPFSPLVTVPVGGDSSTGGVANANLPSSSKSSSSSSTTGTSSTTGSSTGTQTQPVAPRVPVGVELVKLNGTKSATFEVFYNRGTKVETFTVDAPTHQQLSSTGPTVFDTHFGFYSISDSTASVEYDSQSGDNFYTLTLHQVQKLS